MKTEELIRNATLVVGTDPVVISEEQYPANAIRSVILITNVSTGGQKITIAPGDVATAGSGIVLSVGGFYQDSMDSGYMPTNKRISAVADLAAGTVAIHERILVKVQ